jgi:hypothetical protein
MIHFELLQNIHYWTRMRNSQILTKQLSESCTTTKYASYAQGYYE